MAGDWMAWVKGLARKPETLLIARLTGKHRRYVAAALMEFWEWVEENTEDGLCRRMRASDLCAVIPEFDEALVKAIIKAGWLKVEGENIRIPNFDRWMGDNSKGRLKKSRRQQKWRGSKTVDASASTSASTRREEKRRDTKRGKPLLETPQRKKKKESRDEPEKQTVLTREDIEHGTYNGASGFHHDTKACANPACRREQCIAARGATA